MFNEERVKIALKNAEVGLFKYLKIMEMLNKVDVSKDSEFQRKYNHFYKMRSRTEEFYSVYYDLLESSKKSGITFDEALKYIHRKLGRVEASFCSKMVATINPEKPIWDKFVLENLNLKVPLPYSKNRIEKVIELYQEIESWYDEFLKTDEALKMINLFDHKYESIPITNLKKIDLVLWQMRDAE